VAPDPWYSRSLSIPARRRSACPWATVDGTATAGSDYSRQRGSHLCAWHHRPHGGGHRQRDLTAEPDESLALRLHGPVGAAIGRGEGTGLIRQRRPGRPARGRRHGCRVGTTAPAPLSFPVTPDQPSAAPVSVAWTTVDGHRAGSSDYQAAAGRSPWPPGDVRGDHRGDHRRPALRAERDLHCPARRRRPGDPGRQHRPGHPGQRRPPASLSIADTAAAEGYSGHPAMVFTATLSAPSGQPVTAAYATANRTAISGSDYGATSGTVTLAAGAWPPRCWFRSTATRPTSRRDSGGHPEQSERRRPGPFSGHRHHRQR